VLENTHNMAGGRVAGPERIAALAAAARSHRLQVHVDGARLCNAAVAAGCTPAMLAAPVDSVSLCLSKGLGAPIGSLLAGNAEFAKAARRTRKAFGGGMRQAGVLAAAGLLALRDWPELLLRDHARARRLAQGLAGTPGLHVDPATVETNIVMALMPADTIPGFLAFLRERSVLAATAGIGRVRFVTHRDLDDAAVTVCLQAVTAWSKATPTRSIR
jgi:threonine aldolase